MEKLTSREIQVLELSSYGLSCKEIAYELDITLTTVKVHMFNIHRKTGLQNDRETTSAFWAKRTGMIFSIPERFRKRIALALLALTLFTVVFNTYNMQRIYRVRNAKAAMARVRKSSYVDFEINFITII